MPYAPNGQWYNDDEAGANLPPGQAPIPDPGWGPEYQKFSDLYREDLARLRQKNDARMRDYGPVDAFGSSQDYLPPTEIAPDVQMQHDRAVQKYNADLARQAFGTLQKGMENFQYYRPGGAASLAQGLYQGQAQTLLAGRMDPLDLMYNARADASFKARQKARNVGIATAAGTVIGGVAGAFAGPAGAVAGASAGGAIGGALAGGQGAGQGGGAQQQQGELPQTTRSADGMGADVGADVGMGWQSKSASGGAMGGGAAATGGQSAGIQSAGGMSAGGPNVNQQGSSGGGRGASPQGTKSVGGPGAQAMQSAAGPFSPSGMGRMGLSTGAVADTYEMRTGQPIDVTYAAWAADEVVGTMDVMHARLDRLIATT